MGTKPVNAVENMVQVLECLTEPGVQLGVRELAKLTGISVPTVHRLCLSMREAGLVVQKLDTQQYVVGPRLVRLGAKTLGQLDLRRVALPYMRSLRDATGETVTLKILYGRERITVEQVLSPRDPAITVQIGGRHDLVRGAPGKVLLALLPEDRAREIADGAWSALREELDGIRSRGYASSHEEVAMGVAALSAPIFDAAGDPLAALSLVMPTGRAPLVPSERQVETLLEASRSISLELGCPLNRLRHPVGSVATPLRPA